jgi:hypothetical protein
MLFSIPMKLNFGTTTRDICDALIFENHIPKLMAYSAEQDEVKLKDGQYL